MVQLYILWLELVVKYRWKVCIIRNIKIASLAPLGRFRILDARLASSLVCDHRARNAMLSARASSL